MWEDILGALSSLTLSRGARDDDTIDQMHHFGTVAILATFAAMLGMSQYVGDPIHCWVPAQFTDSHQDYTENLCWISHMYYVPMEEYVPVSKADRMKKDVSFYRWIVVILLIQCLLFKFPNMLWKQFKGYSGLNVQKIVNMADEVTVTPPNEREEAVGHMTYFIDRWLRTYSTYRFSILNRLQEKMSGICCFMFGKHQGTYLTGLYMFIKLLYLVNVISQFFLLSAFLNFNFFTYGFEILTQLKEHGEFKDYDHFPRVVLCDIEIRQLQNIQTFSIQCVLSINLFVEKIFAVIWFWLFLLTIASIYNVGHWVLDIFLNRRREQFIQKYLLMLGPKEKSPDRHLFRKFVTQYLRDDGVFLLRSIGNNSSNIVLLDLIQSLWVGFQSRQKKVYDVTTSMLEENESYT